MKTIMLQKVTNFLKKNNKLVMANNGHKMVSFHPKSNIDSMLHYSLKKRAKMNSFYLEA